MTDEEAIGLSLNGEKGFRIGMNCAEAFFYCDLAVQIFKMKFLLPGGVVSYNLPGSEQLVFVCHQPFQSYRSPGVDLSGADAHLGAEP